MYRTPSERSLAKVLILSIVTCGIYYPFWMYATVREMDEFLGESEIPPIIHVLLYLVTGSVWGFVFDILMARRVTKMQQRVGLPMTDNTLLYLVLDLFGLGPYYGLGIVSTLMEQHSLNEIYRARAAGLYAEPRIRIPLP